MGELRELWILVAIAAWLVLVLGAVVLGVSVGLAIGTLGRSRWLKPVLAVLGFCLGIGIATVYFWTNLGRFPAADGSRAKGIWVAASRMGLWLGLSGVLVLVATLFLRLRWGRRQAEPAAPASLLTEEPCCLCGEHLRADEVKARVCRRCR